MQSLLVRGWRRIRRSIAKEKNQNIPTDHKLEDIFLVSFPKSGNTWVRFLIANAIKLHYGIQRDVNFFTIQDIIPDVQLNNNIRSSGPFGIAELPRIIKSHSEYHPKYQRVILIVRNPQDALISYFYYLNSLGIISDDWTLSQFVRSNFGAKAWNKHAQSWLQTKQGQYIRIFKYEDFLADPVQQLAQVMNLLGLSITSEVLEKAVYLSSFENMKKLEQQTMSTRLLETQKTAFVRQGKATGGKELAEADQQYVELITGSTSKALNY
ncbi:MAG: sulfotransferase domain-containing protein [Elainella sp. Prado103]|jgi:hypothetical protein|nr:sulfotransferase domain-containing protein [Elainella sp. Prado103]